MLCKREGIDDLRMRRAGVAKVILIPSLTTGLWFAMPRDLRPDWPFLAILLYVLVVRLVPELWPLASDESSMGPQGDSLIGFEAVVGAVEPVRVEAQGSMWQARVIDQGSVQPGTRVQVVGREGLTLLVRVGGAIRKTT